jgi:hypothetical protein
MACVERAARLGLALLALAGCRRALGIGDLVYRPDDAAVPPADDAPVAPPTDAVPPPADAVAPPADAPGLPPDAGACSLDLSSDPHNCGACRHDCLGGACQSGACLAVKLADAVEPEAIVVDDGYVYWGDSRQDSITRLRKDRSGMPEVLWTGRSPVIDLTADDQTLFFAASNPLDDQGGLLGRMQKDGGGMQVLAMGPVRLVALDRDFVYSGWEGRALLQRQSKNGDGAVHLYKDAPDAGSPIYVFGGMALDESFVYATVPDGQLLRIPKDQNDPVGPRGIARAGMRAGAIAVDDAYVYWSDIKQIYRQPKDGSGSQLILGQGLTPGRIALDDRYVYWTAPGFDVAAGAGSVRRARKDGSAPAEMLAAGLTEPRGIAVDADAVYFSSVGDRAVFRVAK